MAQTRGKKFKQIVEALKKEFKPSRMFLFGSRANGTHRTDSDYDFVLVVPKNRKSTFSNMCRAQSALDKAKLGVSADVFVYSQAAFDEWKDDFSSIAETAVNTGKEIDLTERFYRTIKQEEIYVVGDYQDEQVAEEEIGAYIKWYNEQRPHQALWNYTPWLVHETNNKSYLLKCLRQLKQKTWTERKEYWIEKRKMKDQK